MFNRIKIHTLIATLLLVLQNSCTPTATPQPPSIEKPIISTEPPAALSPTPEPSPTPTPTSVLQPELPTVSYGPDQDNFPPDVNPLTGQQVADPELLKLPALVMSITHFPPQVRPQAGLSFAPWVFEYMIATGTTRFAAIFHGQNPYPEAPLKGGCEVRMEPFVQEGLLLGNRVWEDSNADGVQSPEEQGVGGVCVNLYDVNDELIQQTSTDSNGYYGFNVEAGTYFIEFVKPKGWDFTEPNVGYEGTDSDARQDSGQTDAVHVEADVRDWDAGLIPSIEPDPADFPPAEVGPVRSARLIHIHLQKMFQDSCLVFAGSTKEIKDQIPACAQVFRDGDGGNGSMMDIPRMIALTERMGRMKGDNYNYAHNLFSEETPAGGTLAKQVDIFFSQFDQSRWVYDPTYQGWLRYVDNASEQTEFHVDVDRLSGRQIFFDNVIVLFVEHELEAPLIIEMHLEQGQDGPGFAFRDGQMYEIEWSTRSGDYEKRTGFRRPIAFLDKNGNPFPLRPGRSWIVIATPYSDYSQLEPGQWRFHIYAPPGTGIY